MSIDCDRIGNHLSAIVGTISEYIVVGDEKISKRPEMILKLLKLGKRRGDAAEAVILQLV